MASNSGPNFATDKQRTAIIGRTGSGKTQAAAWHLSRRRWDKMPWIVYDFKTDELLNDIPGVQHITVEDLPRKPGIYLVHPHPDDIDGVQQQMWRIWEAENIGVYCDEGYMVCPPGRVNKAFRSLLTQGRSKHIPMIVLSQRPVWLDRFVFSETEFFQVFHLNDKDDRNAVRRFVPANLDVRLPDYHSYYYDVGSDKLTVFKPVPGATAIKELFAARMEKLEAKTQRVFL